MGLLQGLMLPYYLGLFSDRYMKSKQLNAHLYFDCFYQDATYDDNTSQKLSGTLSNGDTSDIHYVKC